MKKLAVLLSSAVMLAGLSSCAQQEAYSSLPPAENKASSDGPQVVQTAPRVQRATERQLNPEVAQGLLGERLVFFDFDKAEVRDEYAVMLDAHAEYLIDNRGASISLQGHADERGSTEYNLALGQSRSDAVQEYLLSSGVFANQIEAVSYGEERPRALGSDEDAWSQNRRVEIIYSGE